MKKILITGSGGFIFSNFIRHAIYEKAPYTFVSIDKVRKSSVLDNVYFNKNHKFYIGDISDDHFVNVIFEAERPDIVINGAAESVKEDTIIPFRGIKTEHLEIKELWDRFKKNNTIKKVRNSEVINLTSKQCHTLTMKNGFGQWRRITQISRHWYCGQMINMIQKWGEIDVTPNHSIYNSDMELVTPSPGVELLSIRQISPTHSKDKKIKKLGKIDVSNISLDDLLYLVAFYVGEGCTHFNKANGSYLVDFSQNAKEPLLRVQRILNKLGFKTYFNKQKCSHVVVSNKLLFLSFKSECGQFSKNKKVPSFIFKLGKENLCKFINYLVSFDGHKYASTNKKYTTTSKKLAAQLCTILSLAGINYSYSKKVFDNDKWNDAYNLQLNDRYNTLNKKTYKEYHYEGWVYDLEVDDTHKFVCGLGNVLVHNTFVDSSITNVKPFITSNILGTQVLIDASLKWSVEKFVQISTDEVFGHLENESDLAWTEESKLNPRNPYSASKASAELLVQAAHQTHGLNYIITRSCNNYGPRQDPEKFIPKIVKHILEDKKVPVYGAGMQIRDWMYVDDNCSAILKILSDGKDNEIYNISAGQELPNIEVFQRICNELGKGYNLLEFTAERPGHDFRYSIDSSKLRNLGWAPKYKFNDGIRLTINWLAANKWFLNK